MTNAELYVQCGECIATLQTRSYKIAQVHRERIKQLRHIMETIHQKRKAGQIELNVDQISLSPELQRLIGDPTHSL